MVQKGVDAWVVAEWNGKWGMTNRWARQGRLCRGLAEWKVRLCRGLAGWQGRLCRGLAGWQGRLVILEAQAKN